MKRIITLIILLVLMIIPTVYAKEITVYENTESSIMLDIARRYYTVDEIKKYIDVLAQNEKIS